MGQTLNELRAKVNKLTGSIEERNNRLQDLVNKKAAAEKELPSLKEAIALAKKCLEESLEQKKYIEDIVSSGLTEVFGVKHSFLLETVYAPDGTIKGLKPRLKEGEGEYDDPLTSFGAAQNYIASICLRIAILLLSSGTAKVLILDEPLASVNPVLQDRFKVFIENTCKQADLQMIMITHLDQPFGKVYMVSKEKKKKSDISKVQDITQALKDKE